MVKKRKERAEKRQEKEQLGEGGKKVEKKCTWVGRDEKKEEGIRWTRSSDELTLLLSVALI